jgi:hypothetical protein
MSATRGLQQVLALVNATLGKLPDTLAAGVCAPTEPDLALAIE